MKEYRAEVVMTVNFTAEDGLDVDDLKQLALEHLDEEQSYPRGFNFLVCLDTDDEYDVGELAR
jgi:hypothetical protein